MKTTRLTLLRFEERDVPAGEIAWEGGTSDDWTDPANWQGGSVPTIEDTVLLGIATRAPTIPFG